MGKPGHRGPRSRVETSDVYTDAEAEAAERLICVLLRDPTHLDKVELNEHDFYDSFLRGCFECISARYCNSTSTDDSVLAGELGCNVADVRTVRERSGSSAGELRAYSELVSKGAIRRSLYGKMSNSRRAIEQGEDPEAVLEGLIAALSGNRRSGGEAIIGSDAVSDRINFLVDMKRRKDAGEDVRLGVPTGLTALDSYIGGLPFGLVTVEGARPKIGKSSFALQVAEYVASKGDHVHYFPLEDKVSNTVDRLISKETGIPSQNLRSLRFSSEDSARILRAQISLAPTLSNIHFDDSAGLRGSDIALKARRHAKKHKTSLLVVDYLQLLAPSKGDKDDNTKINTALRQLADVAKECNMAVLALSQLSRKVEDRGQEHLNRTGEYSGYTPQPSDFKWSGAIEEICKLAFLLHRPAFYDKSLDDDEMHICPALNNFGEGGKWFNFQWDGPRTRILNKVKR